MDAFTQRAIDPPECQAFGLRLHPVTLGHLFCLLRYVPNVIEGGLCTYQQLLMAAFILSHRTASDCEHSLRRRGLRIVFLVWGWAMRRLKLDLEAEAKRMCKFVVDSCSHPPRVIPKNSRKFGSNGFMLELALAMRELGLSEREALDAPISRLTVLTTAALEADGRLELWSAEDHEFWEHCRQNDLQRARTN